MTLLPRTPLARDLSLGAVVTAVAELELLLNADSVSGPLRWHVLAYLLILPALGLRRLAPLASAALSGVSLALEPVIGPAQVATPTSPCCSSSSAWAGTPRSGWEPSAGLILSAEAVFDLTRDFLLADLVVNVVIIVMAWAQAECSG